MKIQIEQKKLYNILKGVEAVDQDETVLKLKDDRWLIMCRSESDVVMYGSVVPEDCMEDYERGDMAKVGINTSPILDYISKSSDTVTLSLEESSGGVRKLKMSKGKGGAIEMPMINPEYITGVMADSPSLEWEVEFTGDVSFLEDFISRSDNIIGSGSFIISPREDKLYLYSEYDDSSTYEKIDWDEFDDVESVSDVRTMLSVEWASALYFMRDEANIQIGDNIPMKIIFDLGDGAKSSYIICPRIDSDDNTSKVPDRVFGG